MIMNNLIMIKKYIINKIIKILIMDPLKNNKQIMNNKIYKNIKGKYNMKI